MAGRYRTNPIVKHPAFDQGVAASSENDQKHIDHAKSLMPNGLTAVERKCWNRIAPELSKLGRLKSHYVDFVAQYCVVKCRMDSLRAELDKEGWYYTTTGRHGVQRKSHPGVAQLNDDWRKWNSLIAQIGLSPATELRFNDKHGSLSEDDYFGSI